jgi:fructosamine-3-kinase
VPLPNPLRQQVESALGHEITRSVPASGGCINNGARLDTAAAGSFFLKWNASAPPEMFDAEADGLEALRGACTLRIPRPLARGGGDHGPSWLLLEYVGPGAPAPDYWQRLGASLAELHGAPADSGFGWRRANWIGSLTQANDEKASWAAFWRDLRIVPQLELARSNGFMRDDILDRLVEVIPDALRGFGDGGLLHGDLWSGNAYATAEGAPIVIDPAVYRGDGEVDLAMTELFGGFGSRFYDAYDASRAISQEYEPFKRDLYQLYYLLVHVNLFGASYERGSLAAATRVVDVLD